MSIGRTVVSGVSRIRAARFCVEKLKIIHHNLYFGPFIRILIFPSALLQPSFNSDPPPFLDMFNYYFAQFAPCHTVKIRDFFFFFAGICGWPG